MDSNSLQTAEGLGVLHLFCKIPEQLFHNKKGKLFQAIETARASSMQVVTVSILGHKADVAFMVLSNDWAQLRSFQTAVAASGLEIVDSYVSLTEISEYAQGVPEEMRNARLYPELPPDDKKAWCFYPMSKRRNPTQNWFTLPFEKRKELMYEHGASGRKFSGRVLQVITGSTGVDDYEWGVTLFCVHPDDLKDVVYTMRFDEASAEYAEFGSFYSGYVIPIEELLLDHSN
ncbi:MAG: chlorite dismutase [Acidimicrobiaceae bacterium]|nr:chlorite dismutase [Acidimicrobiaceae bacterium]|tara:strand:- start:11 stop:703 length:693 start_codon:yes stop_codon:yes gene_type:complete